jgi:glycosyltransferase involved in cell wall biosynthesis
VVYPPVDLARFQNRSNPPVEDWFLVVSRLVPHKRVDLAVAASAKAGVKLKVIGDGRSRSELEAMAGPDTQFLGPVDDATLVDHLTRCRALILPAAEDFGMTAVEAQAAGRPVIAYGRGGALESVVEGTTGIFFREPTVESVIAAFEAFGRQDWDPEAACRNAARFGKESFLAAIDEELVLALEQRTRGGSSGTRNGAVEP